MADSDPPNFRFTVTDKTFKVVSAIAAVVVIAWKGWNWSIDRAVAERDMQNEHRQFKELLVGTEKDPGGIVVQIKTHHSMLIKLDGDQGKLWSDVEALKKWRDSFATVAPVPK